MIHADHISIDWYSDDIISVNPSLTTEEAMKVLKAIHDKYDCDLGITLDVIEYWVTELYPKGGSAKFG